MAIARSRGVTPVPISPFAQMLAAGQQGIDRGFEMARQSQAEQKRQYAQNQQQAAVERRAMADEFFRQRAHKRSIFEADRAFKQQQYQFDAGQGLAREQMGQRERLAGVGHQQTLAEIAARRDGQIDVYREKARLDALNQPELPSEGGFFGPTGGMFDHARAAIENVNFISGLPPEEQVAQIQGLEQQNLAALARARSDKQIAQAAGNKTAYNLFAADEAQLLGEQDIYKAARADVTGDLAHRAKMNEIGNVQRKRILSDLEEAKSVTRRIDSRIKDLEISEGKSNRPDLDGSEKEAMRAKLEAEKAEALANERAIQADLDNMLGVGGDGLLLPPKDGVITGVPVPPDPESATDDYFSGIPPSDYLP